MCVCVCVCVLSKRSEEVLLIFFVFLEISKMRYRMEINL